MNAPEGGDCGGITARIGNLPREESSSEEMNSSATVIEVEPGRLGAITTAGSGAPAAQQLVWAVLLGSDAGAQQPCAVLCVRCRQVPNGASSAPINTMATAVR